MLETKRGAGDPSPPLMEPSWVRRFDQVAGRPRIMSAALFGRCLRHRLNRYEYAALGFGAELDVAGDEREEGVILPHSDVTAGMPLGSALARDDVAGEHCFATESLQPEPLGVGITSVAGGAACLLVSHDRKPFSSASYNRNVCPNHPSVRISVIRTRVNCCRCPRFLREFFRRRFLKAMTFGPRPCSTTSAATEAPATVGAPRVTASPPMRSTSSNLIVSPGWASILSTSSTSWATTRYCFPPVLMTANIFEFPCSIRMLGPTAPLRSPANGAGKDAVGLGFSAT